MRTLKSLSRRGLALLLTLVMCTGMVNLSAFASDGEQDWDENFQLPNPQEVAMMMEELDPEAEDYEEQLAMLEMLQYPMQDSVLLATDGRGYKSFAELLLGVHPKNGVGAPVEGGVWSAEGQWEDGSDVLSMDEDGRVVINEPKGSEARVTVKYTFPKASEAPAENNSTPVVDETPKAEAPAPSDSASAEEDKSEQQPEETQPDDAMADNGDNEPQADAPEDGADETEGAEPAGDPEAVDGDTANATEEIADEPAPRSETPDQTEEPASDPEPAPDEPASEPEQQPQEPASAPEQPEEPAEPEPTPSEPETTEPSGDETGSDEPEAPSDTGSPDIAPPSAPAPSGGSSSSNSSAPAAKEPAVETVAWTVMFTSDVEALEGDKITKWSQLKNGGVYILDADLTATGSRTISSDTVVDLNGHAIRYGNKNNGAPFKGNLFHVTGGTLTIQDNSVAKTGTIQGTGTKQSGNTGSLVLVNGGTLKLEGGTLTGNYKGEKLADTHTITTASERDSHVGAGVYVKKGVFNMTGGAISNNHTVYTDAVESAAGSYQVVSALRPYYILSSNNSSYVANSNGTYRYNYPVGQGGGVYVSEDGTFTMSGTANISNNHAGEGGGIFVKGVFTMTQGTVDRNIAHLGEGGGIYIQSNKTENLVSGGSITNNETYTTEDLGGGGIYVENDSRLRLNNALITNNDAQGLGGGIAACIHGKIAAFALNGAAVYENHAMSPNTGAGFVKSISMKYFSMMANHYSDDGRWLTYDQYRDAQINGYHTFIDSYHLWANDTDFQNKAQDIFSAGSDTQSNGGAIVSNQMLGGLANWSGYAWTGNVKTTINETNNDVVKAGTLLSLTAAPNPMPTKKAAVTISGNKAKYTHGGGLATNGLVLIGEEGKSNPTPVELTIRKTFDGPEKEFTFGLFDADGTTPIQNGAKQVTATVKASNGKDGTATLVIPASAFTDIPAATEQGKTKDYTFKVKEINTNADDVKYDPTTYEVKVSVTATVKTQNLGGANQTVTTQEAELKSVKPVAGSGSSTAAGTTLVFNNKVKRGSLALNKNLVQPVAGEADSWTFHIKLEGGSGLYDGKAFIEGDITVTSTQGATISDIPVGVKYTVTEVNKDGTRYETSDEVTEAQTIVEGPNNNVTIKNERLYSNLTVKKLVDYNETTSEAPANDDFYIVVKLGDGSVSVEEGSATYVANGKYVFKRKANGEATITGIPTGTTYTVEEYLDEALTQPVAERMTGTTQEGYSQTVRDPNSGTIVKNSETVTVQNHYYQPKYTEKTVIKTWGVPDKILVGESIAVQLYQKDVATSETKPYGGLVTLNKETVDKDGAWIYTWSNLPEYAGDGGHAYPYYVEEVSVNYGDLKAEVEAYLTENGKTDKKLREENPIVRDDEDHTLFRIYGSDFNEKTGEYEILGGFRADINGFNITNAWIPAEDIGDGSFELVKVENLGDASQKYLSGATFTLAKENGEVISAQTTNVTEENPTGKLTFSGLREGKYILTETKAPEGYQGFETPWTVTVTPSLVKVEGNDKDGWQNRWEFTASGNGIENNVMTVENKFITGKISVNKSLALDGVIENIPEDFTEKLFQFGIYKGKADEIAEDAEPIETLQVKGDGKDSATSGDLRYGWYTLRETVAAELPDYLHVGTEFNIYQNDGKPASEINEIEVFIDEQGKTHEVYAANHYVHDTGSLSVRKTVVGVPADGAFEFEVTLIFDQAYVAAGMELDEDGKFTLPVTGVEQTEIEFTLDGLTARGALKVAHGQKAVIEGIPSNTIYTVEEKNAGSYAVESLNNTENSAVVKDGEHEVAFVNTQWIGTSVNLNVRKVLSYQDIDNMSMVNRQFVFELFQLEEDNGSAKETKIGELKLGGSEFNLTPASVFKLDYSHEKNGLVNGQEQTFAYEIREVETPGQGYTWAPRVGVEVTVSVKDGQYYVDKVVYDRDDTLTEAVFNNKINVFTGDKGKIQLGGLKNLNGSLSDRAFDFTLTDVTDPVNPIVVETVQNAVSAEDRGVFKFSEIELSAAGMTAEKYQVKNAAGDVERYQYKYEIREVSAGAGNLYIDQTVYTVIVDVKDVDGVMQVQKYTYIPVDAEGVESDRVESDEPEAVVFHNVLTPPPPTTPPTTPERPTTPPDEPIPDPDVPLTPGPGPEPSSDPGSTPEVEIPGDGVPLAPAPEIPEEEEVVFDEDVPLASMPPEEEIFDGDVPLANVPKTGDSTGLWAALTALSGASLAALGLTGKKRKDDEQE